MNKFFINKRNGTRRSVISKLLLAVLLLGTSVFSTENVVLAAPAKEESASSAKIVKKAQSYTQIFQNPTTTLSGRSVQTSLYFSKIDYWKMKKATFTMNFEVSQLANKTISDITLSLNGVKFASFRPSAASGLQTKQVDLPLQLLKNSNTLKISGQVLNTEGTIAKVEQTPANWLTINSGASVNFSYDLEEATDEIRSFYAHFTGMDTIANHRAAIVVSKNAGDAELTAAATALTGIARLITTTDTKLPILEKDDPTLKNVDYQLVIDKPAGSKKGDAALKAAMLKTSVQGNKHYLSLSADTPELLEKGAQFVANEELMTQTKAPKKRITSDTQTFTSVLEYQGKRQLTAQPTTLVGAGQQSVDYFVALPTDRTNVDGSTLRLNFRYAKNLNFERALLSVKVNGELIGSKKLQAKHADDDSLTVKLPKGHALGSPFTVSVVCDLEVNGENKSDNKQTPWLVVDSSSSANIRSHKRQELLFSNFPSTFVSDGQFDNLLVVRPRTMTRDDLATMTNLFNLFGNYVQHNTGTLKVQSDKPNAADMKNRSVVAFGSANENSLVNDLNDKLYFKYNADQSGFLSNEKLSLESEYAKTVGTNQLLRSPYDDKRALLVVTGPTALATRLAAEKIGTQAEISQYSGDAVVVDPDNRYYSYRFKKNVMADRIKSNTLAWQRNAKAITLIVVALAIVALLAFALFLVLRKNKSQRGLSK